MGILVIQIYHTSRYANWYLLHTQNWLGANLVEREWSTVKLNEKDTKIQTDGQETRSTAVADTVHNVHCSIQCSVSFVSQRNCIYKIIQQFASFIWLTYSSFYILILTIITVIMNITCLLDSMWSVMKPKVEKDRKDPKQLNVGSPF